MSERFQTFTTRLRPHRIAILTNVIDQDWQNTCTAIIEYLSQIWGGYHSLIIPTDGKTIDDTFWALLSSFDPDVILRYQKTAKDLRRTKPEEFEKIVAAQIEHAKAQGYSTDGTDSMIREDLANSFLEEFSISPELAQQLLIRLAPFHFENDLLIKFISAGTSPGYPFTSVADIVEYVPAPDAIFEVRNNLPPEREAPPALWLAAESGIATAEHQAVLQPRGVSGVLKFMNTATDNDLIKWGIQPWYELGVNSPFSFTRLALATVRANAARRYAIPSIIVRGDTIKDFCLYYGLSRLHSRAIWAPSWFDLRSDSYSGRLATAVRNLYEMGRREVCEDMCVISTSIANAELHEMVTSLRNRTMASSFAVEDGNSASFIRKIVEYSSKIYIKKNIDQITTHQIVDDRMPGFFESPVPLALTRVNPQIHRWLVEISYMDFETPRHPALGRYLASGSNLSDVRAGIDGVVFQCPGMMVLGDDIELQMLRISVSLPSSEKIFGIALGNCGYDCEISDKGRYEGETINKFGGLQTAACALHHSETSRLLKEFLSKKGPTEGVFDEGVYLNDKRRYLNFACLLKFFSKEAFARKTVDDYIAKGILYRGLVLKCNRCSDLAWFSIAEVTQDFRCRRCGISQQYTYDSWSYPNEPSWFYKLDEIVYQMLQNNGDVTLLTLDALRRESKDNFQFSPELSIKPSGIGKWTMEIDVACIMRGKIIIGEAKSVDTIAVKGFTAKQVAVKYRDLAERLGASGVVFSTSMQEWNEATNNAIDSAFAQYPHIKVYRYTAAQL